MKILLLVAGLLAVSFGHAQRSDQSAQKTDTYQLNVYGQCIIKATGQIVLPSYCQSAATNKDYELNSYGQCISKMTGQLVAISYCQSTTTNKNYELNSYGQCISKATGQLVQTSFCSEAGQSGPEKCYGSYSYDGKVYQCGIQYNCSGYVMISVATGKKVYCE